MGLFDKMFGRGASTEPDAQQRFNELKGKYQTVLSVVDQEQVQLQNLHVQDGKLLIKGIAPSQGAKDKVWDQIKLVDAGYDKDLICDIGFDAAKAAAAAAGGGSGADSYEVRAGDSLSKISKQFYGDPNEYMRIYYANRDKLRDPDHIQVGQKLTIPKE